MPPNGGNGRTGLAKEPSAIPHPGERTNGGGKPVSNRILLSISEEEYHKIRTHLEFVALPQGFNLHEPPERLKFAYFLNRGLASIVVGTKGGRDVEAGMVGYEGLVGTALAVGLDTSPLREVVQIEGDAFRIGAEELQYVLRATPGLQMMLNRYAVLQGMQVAQTAACNRLHDLRQRLARWLLMAQDRVDNGLLPITHEFLAIMLGTDRPSVTLAAGELQRSEVIRYRRAAVKILNRKRLEAAACSCYRVVQQLNGELGLK
jgi:CRP-like cAMP-binding protein